MKKLLMIMAVAACACTALADRTVLSWFTMGPDKYADGTVVKEGEFYALVFLKEGATFAGFNADGTLVDAENAEVLAMGPWAKAWTSVGMGCPPHNVQPESEEAAKYAGGSLRLFVLDTRTTDGKLAAVEAKTGKPTVVNGYGEASNVKFLLKDARVFTEPGKQVKAGLASAVPPKAAQPKITGIRVENGYAYITVANTEPYLQYNVATGRKPGEFMKRNAAVAAKQGAAGREIELKVPVDANGQFFKINRNGLESK